MGEALADFFALDRMELCVGEEAEEGGMTADAKHLALNHARVHASSLSGGGQPRTSPRTCKSARQRSSIDSQCELGVNKFLSHIHITSSSFLLAIPTRQPKPVILYRTPTVQYILPRRSEAASARSYTPSARSYTLGVALQSIPHPCTLKLTFKHHRPSTTLPHLLLLLLIRLLGLL